MIENQHINSYNYAANIASKPLFIAINSGSGAENNRFCCDFFYLIHCNAAAK
jgi:hypothetical protein